MAIKIREEVHVRMGNGKMLIFPMDVKCCHGMSSDCEDGNGLIKMLKIFKMHRMSRMIKEG